MITIMGAVSRWEREAIGERTRDALRHKRGNGERVGKYCARLPIVRRRKAFGSGRSRTSSFLPRFETFGLQVTVLAVSQRLELTCRSHAPRN